MIPPQFARFVRHAFGQTKEEHGPTITLAGDFWSAGKVREIPVRHDLQQALKSYLDLSGRRNAESSSPLTRSVVRRAQRTTQNRLTSDDMARMVKRRLKHAGLSMHVTAFVSRHDDHRFAGTGSSAGGRVVPSWYTDPRTTRLLPALVQRVSNFAGNLLVGLAVNDSTGFEFAKLPRGNVLVVRTQKTLLTTYLLRHTLAQ